ncbi:MAG TPA: hypothetical protein VF092_00880 [Longimicrobium sp.]
MRITHVRSAILLTAAALAAAIPSQGRAQAAGPRGFFVGVGAGLGRTAEPGNDASHISPALHLRAGWAFTPSLSLVVEAGANAIGSLKVVDQSIPDIGPPVPAPRAIKLQTEWVMASLQVGDPATFYVRPGVGVARHAYDKLTPVGNDQMVAGTGFETGLAAGVAAGRQVRLIPGFPLNVEGIAVWTQGEDSTRPRWSTGLQVVHDFHF